LDSISYPYSQYYYGKSLKYLGEYEKAIMEFNKFLATTFKKEEDQMAERKGTLNMEIEGCKLGINYLKEPVKVSTEHLGTNINHPLTDFSPRSIEKGRMFYAALPPDSAFALEDSVKGRFTRFYISTMNEEDEWQPSLLLAQHLCILYTCLPPCCVFKFETYRIEKKI